ncbi:apolipoprotein N-acyltransferase [Propioniciclava coleopterorum]|nr:apolipoprotein N-acyltransferase [Propioniciclava coleopterorum]
MARTATQPWRLASTRWPAVTLVVLAAVGGLLASLAFAPIGWAPCAVLAVVVLGWCVRRARGLGAALASGWAFGVAFMGTSLIWQTEILILSYAGMTLATSLVYVGVALAGFLTRDLRAWPIFGAAAWSLCEFVISVWPFDGFGWMRLGYTQLDTPLAGLYPLVGAAGVTFVVAALGQVLLALLEAPGWSTGSTVAWVLVAVLAAGAGGSLIRPTSDGEVAVGWVQGGAPGGGVYGLGPARTITYNSRDETAALMRRVDAGELPRPQFIAWPENSTDMDPRADVPTRAAVEEAVAVAGVPILVGSIYEDVAAETRQTVALWWTDAGADLTYAKRNLVPFGEWIPGRDLLLPLIPELRYVGAQSVPGTEPGSFPARLPDGRTVEVGVAICYEVIFPGTLYQAVDAGAQVMIVQSSNAMYQGTNQIAQQFTATRVRAAEMRRTIQVVTTSGVSGLIGPQGQVLRQAPDSVAASGVDVLPLETTPATPAMRLQSWLEYGLSLIAASGMVWGLSRRVAARRGGTMEGKSSPRRA